MIWRIRRRSVFTDLRKRGVRVRSGGLRMTYCPQPDPHPLVGFALGRGFGSAVERNRARRRLRAAFAAAWDPEVGPKGAFLLTGDRSILRRDFAALTAAVENCLAQLRASREPNELTRNELEAPCGAGGSA